MKWTFSFPAKLEYLIFIGLFIFLLLLCMDLSLQYSISSQTPEVHFSYVKVYDKSFWIFIMNFLGHFNSNLFYIVLFP